MRDYQEEFTKDVDAVIRSLTPGTDDSEADKRMGVLVQARYPECSLEKFNLHEATLEEVFNQLLGKRILAHGGMDVRDYDDPTSHEIYTYLYILTEKEN